MTYLQDGREEGAIRINKPLLVLLARRIWQFRLKVYDKSLRAPVETGPQPTAPWTFVAIRGSSRAPENSASHDHQGLLLSVGSGTRGGPDTPEKICDILHS